MSKSYEWLEKTTPRSVSQLKPWPENPRLDPERHHSVTKDYVEDLISDNGEKESFLALIKRISEKGYIPVAPMVVWQNKENQKFYVAEGNRRLLAVKLLLKPNLAPLAIRSRIMKYSNQANLRDLKKIKVSVAPTLEDAEWFIAERNSSASTIRPWSREQQQRWIVQLYEKYEGDTEKIHEASNFSLAQIKVMIRTLIIRDFVKNDLVKSKLSEEQYKEATSHRFKMTVLERFLASPYFRDRVGLEYQETDVVIKSIKNSFYSFYTALIIKILNGEIDTRFTIEDIPNILDKLPEVIFPSAEDSSEENQSGNSDTDNSNSNQGNDADNNNSNDNSNDSPTPDNSPVKEDRNRRQIIMKIYHIDSTENRLYGIFNELKVLPVRKYPNHCAVTIRVFLDLAVLDYLCKNDLTDELIAVHSAPLNTITLKNRFLFLKSRTTGKPKKVIEKLLNHRNEFSLDELNSYVHSTNSHNIEPAFLNRFWDFLFPLICNLVKIDEN